MNATYAILDLLLILIILWCVFYGKFKLSGPAIITSLIVGLVFYIWDIVFFRLLYWGVNWNMTLGLELFNVPIEQILYYPLVSIFILLLAHRFSNEFPDLRLKDSFRNFYLVLLLVGVLLMINYRTNMITFVCALLSSLAFGYLWLSASNKLGTKVFLVFVLSFIPFLILNWMRFSPILGDSLTWYSDTLTSGIRMGRIPIESTFKWFVMVFLTLTIEQFGSNEGKQISNSDQ